MSETNLDTIKNTLVGISRGDTTLDMLLEFERTLDNTQIFAYKNWISGELVEGPEISRYWFKTTWMWPAQMMPDPNGGLRLTKIGAKVNFRKGIFKKPVKVEGPKDWVDPQTKRAKISEHKVWLVEINLPIKYINRGLEQADDIIQRDIDKTNDELANAFEDEVPEELPAEDMTMSPDMGAGMDTGEDPMAGGVV